MDPRGKGGIKATIFTSLGSFTVASFLQPASKKEEKNRIVTLKLQFIAEAQRWNS